MAGLIQEQERAQHATSAELAASERNLRMVLNSTREAFLVINPDGGLLHINSVARAMFGVPEEAGAGSLGDFLKLKEPVAVFLDRHLKATDGFGSSAFSLRTPARGGLMEMQLEGTVRPIRWHERDALLVVFRDVTRQHAAQEQLREGERRYRTLFENATDAILLVEEGRVTDCNFKAIQLLGAGRSEIIGQTLASLSPPVLPTGTAVTEALTQIEESLELTGLAVQEWVFRRAKGAPVTVELKMVRTKLEGKPLTEVIATDITARLQLEEQLRQAQKLEAVGKLAGGVAHDFNNLLTIIDSNLWLLDQNFPAETAEGELLKDIRGASDRAAELTRQLLAFSRRQIIQARAVDLGHLLTNLEKMVGRMAGEQVNCQVVAKPGTPLIQADPGMIEQIVINLAVNARDAMAAGGKLTISCEGKEVGFDEVNPGTDARPGLFAKLSIVDNGCGMDEATAKRIFEPFFTTKEFGKGTGLGLAMVYGIIKQHRGWVEVESHPGKGTAFHIYLPAVKALPLDAVEPHPPQRAVGGEIVLLVEDEAPLRQAVHTALSRFGYRVLSAGNASDARRLWKEYPGKIDVLVTDLVMPGSTNGSELALQLQGEAPRLKAILMSGYSEEFSRRGAESSPNTAFLQKPFSPSDLAALIRSLLDGNSAKS